MTSGVVAAPAISEEFNLSGVAPVVLQDTNNTVVWLRPHPVVAKVATTELTKAGIVREHDVGRHLARCGAPVRHPWSHAPIRVHEPTGCVVSMWDFLEESGDGIGTSVLAASLQEIHRALASFPGSLPSFRHGLAVAGEVLSDDRVMRGLSRPDLVMLRSAFAALLDELHYRTFVNQPLHGEPHLGNVLSTAAGPRWIDFEASCTGPLEWDLAFLPRDAVALFPAADRQLLALLRPLNSARVATWRWARAELPGMRAHAEHHLEVVRRATT